MKPEQIEQIIIFDWIRSNPDLEPFCFHIANERKTTPQEGRILKRIGVKSGVSDIFIGIPKGRYHGMFLELKAGSNKPTENQEQFMINMIEQGYYCTWVTGFQEAKCAIIDYLVLEKSSC